MGYEKKLDYGDIEFLKTKDDPVISVHGDADGVSSGILLSKALGKDYNDLIWQCPRVFGDTSTLGVPDIVLDQAPIDPEYNGLVVDHHPAHFSDGRNNQYHLVWSPQFCTARLLYESLKEEIPEEYHWLASLGIAGDGGEDEVPSEIFLKSPELLTETGYTYGRKYGSEMDYTAQLAFVVAKSLINYGTRVGETERVLQKLSKADTAMDILHDTWFYGCKDTVKREIKNLYKDSSEMLIDVYGDIGYCEYSSDMRLWVAQDFFSRINKTALALNKETGSFSIRGPLASLIAGILDRIDGISAGGHLSYAGGSLEDKSSEFLRKHMAVIDRNWKEESVEKHIENVIY